jgi:hypothetical protein
MPVILATQEAESGGSWFEGQVVHETLSQKTHHKKKKRAGGVVQGVGPEFKPQYGEGKKQKGALPLEPHLQYVLLCLFWR